jgi:hypothetical protein
MFLKQCDVRNKAVSDLKCSDNFDANCSADAASELDLAVSGLVFYRMGARVRDLISRSVEKR